MPSGKTMAIAADLSFSCCHGWMHCLFLLQVEKAPLESYADVGGLEQQVQEIKEAVELPLTNPELYEDIGIKPPKVCQSDSYRL